MINKIFLIFFFFKKYIKLKNKNNKIEVIKKKLISKLEYSLIAKVMASMIIRGKMIVGKWEYLSRVGLKLLPTISLEIKILNAVYDGKT